MRALAFLTDKTGVLGTVITAMGCASCFPALGTLAASLGLGFLAQFEGVFINALLPIFTAIVLISNLVAWYKHRLWCRGILSITGPSVVLSILYFFGTPTHGNSIYFTAH